MRETQKKQKKLAREPEDQGTRGPGDQGTRGPEDQRTRGPGAQWGQREERRGPRSQGYETRGRRAQSYRAIFLNTRLGWGRALRSPYGPRGMEKKGPQGTGRKGPRLTGPRAVNHLAFCFL